MIGKIVILDFVLGAIGGVLVASLFFLATRRCNYQRGAFRWVPRDRRQGTPLISTLEMILSRRRNDFAASDVHGHLIVGDDLFISVSVPAGVLGHALDLVLGHALAAVRDRPVREISFVIESEEHYCRVDVKDTGLGYPEEEWERIFEQSVPTRGADNRLHTARDMLAPYGGKVFIKHSVPDEETAIRIILPTASA